MESLKNELNKLRDSLGGALKTPRGKDVLTYLLFVAVAFVFWLMLSLDSEVQRDYDIPIEIENIPDSITLISNPPATINVSVTAKGAVLLPYNWGRIPTLRLNFHEYVDTENTWGPTGAKLESRVRDYFGSGTLINSIRPDSLRLIYTNLPGEKLPLKVNLEAHPNLQSVISGKITANVDSVMAYAPKASTRIPPVIETESIVLRNLKDTTVIEAKLRQVAGVRLIPDRVLIKIPIEPLISKRQMVPVTTINIPDHCDLITFPSKVEVTFLVPMSRYYDDTELSAFVNFRDIVTSRPKTAVKLGDTPDYIRSISINPDSVEYVIETTD